MPKTSERSFSNNVFSSMVDSMCENEIYRVLTKPSFIAFHYSIYCFRWYVEVISASYGVQGSSIKGAFLFREFGVKKEVCR